MKKNVFKILATMLCCVIYLFPLTACGKEKGNGDVKDGLLYFTLGEDTYYYVSDVDKEAENIVIPDTFKGAPVTGIGYGAFEYCEKLKSVTIPDSISYIKPHAFEGCYQLTSITIPDTVTSIAEKVFYKCYNLKSVNIPNSVLSIDSSAFTDCTCLVYNGLNQLEYLGNEENPYLYLHKAYKDISGSVTIQDGCKFIGDSVFSWRKSLTDVTIPDSVIAIGTGVFEECDNLINVNIPNGVNSIGNYVFLGCDNIQYNEDGNLKYLGDEENPYVYLLGVTDNSITTFDIKKTCRFIGSWAFSYSGLKNIIISNNIVSISSNAFMDCKNLTHVAILGNIRSIGRGAFNGCVNLQSITFDGTKEEWNKIYYGFSDNVVAEVSCIDGNVAL